MSGLINTLTNIFSLEQKRGYSNTAVVGGLANFIGFLQSNANTENISAEDINSLISLFNRYAVLSLEDRITAVSTVIKWMRDDPGVNRLHLTMPSSLENAAPKPESHGQDKALSGLLQSIRGIGEKNSLFFNKLGIFSIYDLLRFFPRRYQDFSQLKTINRLEYGDELSVIGTLKNDLYTRNAKRGNLKIIEGVLSDSTGSIKITWFNQPYLANQIGKGSAIVVSGKVDMYLGRLVMNSPDWEPLDSDQLHTNRIVPIYPLTAGLSQRQIRKIIYQNLPFWSTRVKEYLPEEVLECEKYPPIANALSHIHFPDNTEQLDQTRARLAFEEIFFLQLGVLAQKTDWSSQTARRYALSAQEINKSEERLPYQLTNDQKAAIKEILADLNSGHPMNRLLQGDVGSGKTVVAKFAIQTIIENGAQAAVMTPTSILAEQHFRTLTQLLTQDEVAKEDEIALLIGSTPQKERPEILEKLADGRIKVLVGTHALLEDPVTFNDLQLAVIDEQHRFGVEQRIKLHEKGENPHLLVMTATPIPRSLALTVYGDLDVTTISEMPAGRQPVETRLLHPNQRKEAYTLIRDQVAAGFQAFIIYPLVESEEETDEDYRAAVNEKERLAKEVFPDLKIGLMHGKLKPAEKEKVMLDFRKKKYQILVSTTVIEVGVDIPSATVVLIEGANHFGLAQLHQIRGRVGRNMDQSYCLLIPENETALENERLAVMVKTNDGFKLAEFDLDQRGPGEFLGTRQSGYAGLRFSSITDTQLIEKCRKYAKAIFEEDPGLSQPEHQLLLEQLKYCWPGIQFNLNN
ncbi:ATP-dependent DNA helicase RecG [Pelolinea submarina]|uniref:ATP-dependent DNA helicase RecG n=1 Tax=Pelolinea submarina TaxID=913107 RepID=A0A347ZTD4_9CHLR|nr:ATP-dependent DNA helicase RecG [Pelolinea submarina]REG10860.1 ATP-dependent DNA helicase RecG [Pelolinea submarina]BBB48565.1 ATP-dependent DNA helicase RecG [Pelolinea submarina]